MRIPRRLAATLAIGALAVATLAGCVGGDGPVETKTDSVLAAIANLPGVVGSSSTFNEHSITSAPHSLIELEVDPEATAVQVGVILKSFAKANTQTGLTVLSSELHLATHGGPDKLELLYAPITDAQAAALAEGWLDLRGRYASTDLGLVLAGGAGYVVNLAVGLGQSGFEASVAALQDARAVLGPLGDVGRYEQVDGRFAASGGIPDDTALTLLAAMNLLLGADGQDPDLRGEYDGGGNSFSLVADVAASTDAATGLNAAIVRTLASIPASGPGLAIEFHAASDKHVVATFDDRSCDAYLGKTATDPNAALLLYWARDGRTLLDGSTAQSCLS